MVRFIHAGLRTVLSFSDAGAASEYAVPGGQGIHSSPRSFAVKTPVDDTHMIQSNKIV